MQNFVNNNYEPDVNFFNKLPNPATNEPFNRATHPADKPITAKHIFVIDSRQRNYEFYPNANNYNISIPDRYRNVTGIELKAAMIPRTEYNVNSSNKYIDFILGDFIKEVIIQDLTVIIKKNGFPINNTNTVQTYSLNISPPTLEQSHIIKRQAKITVQIDQQSYIVPNSIIIEDSGSGYSFSAPPQINLGDMNIFKVKIGFELLAELREGQYVIGGNPQFLYPHENENENIKIQSYTPNNFLNEIECALSSSILMSGHGLMPKSVNHVYRRKSWVEYYKNGTPSPPYEFNDYPLFFCSRLMSQYPNLESYNNFNADVSPKEAYETNSCKFNRIYISNILSFKINGTLPPHNLIESATISYEIKQYFKINDDEYIAFYSLSPSVISAGTVWDGINIDYIEASNPGLNINFAHWELLFASGRTNIINSASLLGFNKKNYYRNTNLKEPIQISNSTFLGTLHQNTLIPRGLTYSAENDYCLYGDPEYIVLSFKPKYGGNSISGINERVQSQPDSNIDRVFACLIYDSVNPAVLQDMSSGTTDVNIHSYGSDTNLFRTFQNSDYRPSNNYPNTGPTSQINNNVQQLTGNSGNQNVNFQKAGSMLKAMKGSDFDQKLIEFIQPIAQIHEMNIRFSKFTQLTMNIDRDDELYNFAGKEHLLMFEITCGDFLTGKRF